MPVTTACSRSGGIRRSRSAPGYALTRRSKRDDAARLHAHAEEDDRPGGAGIPETFRLGELELLLRHAGPGRAEVQERRPAGPGPDDHLARHPLRALVAADDTDEDRKSTRLNSSHSQISYAVFCLKKKKQHQQLEVVPVS